MLTMIVAYSKNHVIGLKNDMPWHLPADLKHFKEITMGSTVIMGRNTYESIKARLGHGLPGRQNIVLTRDELQPEDGVVFVRSLEEALEHAERDEVFIIGGAQVFEQSLGSVERIFATEIDVELNGDTFFPELPDTDWQVVETHSHAADEKNPHAYTFLTYERMKK